MRVHNNLGLLAYAEGDDIAAHIQFQASLLFSKELLATTTTTNTTATTTTTDYRLEHATILSNWCRVTWMKGCCTRTTIGDDEALYAGLQEILAIRSTLLAWDDADLAASHYNLAAAEYARQNTTQAVYHLKKYLAVAAHRRQNHHHHYHHTATTTTRAASSSADPQQQQQQQQLLDPIPALIYLLLLENENQDNCMSQELVRGLYALQDKCQDEGQESLEVANVLNFIGTLLFHKKDLHNALLFFEEELRVEDKVFGTGKKKGEGEETGAGGVGDMSVSVTCNNIGRICQDLGRCDEALHYYERALQQPHQPENQRRPAQDLGQPTANLYSTVWYNMGLIHDRRGAHAQAIAAFGNSLELRKSFLSQDHPDIACIYFNIGVLQMEQDKLDDASISLKQALKSRASSVAAANKLDDQRVIKTFEKLAIMFKTKGNMQAAIDALVAVLRVLQVTKEFDTMTRIKDMALVLRSMSELYHATGDMSMALAAAQDSVRHLDFVYQGYNIGILVPSNDKLANIEQLVASILLVGSLYHEMCEPLKAQLVFHQAVACLETTIATYQHLRQSLPSSLHALQEVTGILASPQCAPQA
jgi:tetratricopeptide (TPR) repeat protein